MMQNEPLVTGPKLAQPCVRVHVHVRVGGQSLLSLPWKPLTLPVLCPQEPDQVYEGITFDDFLKVRVQGESRGCGRGGLGGAGWSGDGHLRGKGRAWRGL